MTSFGWISLWALKGRISVQRRWHWPQRANSTTRSDFYIRYLKAHRRGKKKGWGTYFQRMIVFGAQRVNQLERVIIALTTWPNNYKAAFIMHTSSAETDRLRPLGGPCLQYIQFNCPTSTTIDLLAVYRNHDYCSKVLGNFFGLSRLLRFVCTESNRQVGNVSCLSVHAYFNSSIKKQKLLAGIP
jgi:thymidylate synthase